MMLFKQIILISIFFLSVIFWAENSLWLWVSLTLFFYILYKTIFPKKVKVQKVVEDELVVSPTTKILPQSENKKRLNNQELYPMNTGLIKFSLLGLMGLPISLFWHRFGEPFSVGWFIPITVLYLISILIWVAATLHNEQMNLIHNVLGVCGCLFIIFSFLTQSFGGGSLGLGDCIETGRYGFCF